MSLIKQIELALTSINQARFQDLVNHFLHLKGYKFIAAPGSVVAKEKTSKGAPDAFFFENGKYIFLECTTQEKIGKSKTFFNKLQSDIHHCFDETSIKKTEIKKVILACTERLSADEFNELLSTVKSHNSLAELLVYNIQNLPFEIIDFPGLSETYLGISALKGDIYSLPDFLQKTTKGLQPSLVNPFLYRDDEVKAGLEHLRLADILVLSGQAGTGKSKLATIIQQKMEEERYVPLVIQSLGVPLWDDMITLLQYDRKYIILFDDANKAINNLEYLLSLIEKPRPGSIKLIITVRDYVRNDLNRLLGETRFREINLQKLKDKEISDIIKEAVPVLNHYPQVVERIVEISKGNARVALMAAYSAKPGAETNYLDNPVLLYEKYFNKVSTELDIFQNKNRLKALAIISFFGAVDRNNNKISTILKEEFNIDWDELWEDILFLHRHELVDVYQNQVCKVSDQVLATYAFFQCFVNSNTLVISLHSWIQTFLEAYPKRLKNALIDVNNTFGYPLVKDLVSPHLDRLEAEIKGNIIKQYTFYETFWYYRETQTLLYLKNWIKDLPDENELKELSFKYTHNNYIYPSKMFDLLIRFWDHPSPLIKTSISLGINLIFKQTSRLGEFLKFSKEHLSFKRFDYSNNYFRQNIFLDELFKTDYSPYNKKIVDGIFINIAESYLGWEFNETGGSNGREITIYSFRLFKDPALMDLRKRVLEKLFSLYSECSIEVDAILKRYVFPDAEFDNSIHADELGLFQPFIISNFTIDNYNNCKFIQKFSKALAKGGFDTPSEWSKFIDADILKLGKFLKTEVEEREGLSNNELKEKKAKALQELVINKPWDDIKQLLLNIETLNDQQTENNNWWITSSVTEIFRLLATTEKENFIKAMDLFFGNPLTFEIHEGIIIHQLSEGKLLTSDEFYLVLNKHNFSRKIFWKLSFFHFLPEAEVSPYYLDEFVKTYQELDIPLSIHNFHTLIKYNGQFLKYKSQNTTLLGSSHNILTYLTEILLVKTQTVRINFGYHFIKECSTYFTENIQLLKQVYTQGKKLDNHFDYDGKELEALMKLDNGFFIEYLGERVVDFEYLSFRFDSFKLDFIWDLPQYKSIMNDALEIIVNKAPLFSSMKHPANVLFAKTNFTEILKVKVFSFIEEFIQANYDKKQHMHIIMNVVSHTFPDQVVYFLKHFLLLNKDVEFVKHMWLEKGGAITGSRVPNIQSEIILYNNVLEMVRQLPDVLDYADHIDYWERRVRGGKNEILQEQKRDFSDMYD